MIKFPGGSSGSRTFVHTFCRHKEDNPRLITQRESPGPGQPASAQRPYPRLLITPGVPASATLSLCLGEIRLSIQGE